MGTEIILAGKSSAIFVSTTSQASPLPTLANGTIARIVMVQATLVNTVLFRLGDSNSVAVLSDTCVLANGESILIQCDGATHIANITAVGNASFVVTPVGV